MQSHDHSHMAMMCGCVQNYLREQPDNMKSFNLVAETTQFVSLVYSNINAQNIDLAIELFDTLNEFSVVSITCTSIMGFTLQVLVITPCIEFSD